MPWLWKVHCCFLHDPKPLCWGILQMKLGEGMATRAIARRLELLCCGRHVLGPWALCQAWPWPTFMNVLTRPSWVLVLLSSKAKCWYTHSPFPLDKGKWRSAMKMWDCSHHNSSGTSKTCFALSAHTSFPPDLASWRKKRCKLCCSMYFRTMLKNSNLMH